MVRRTVTFTLVLLTLASNRSTTALLEAMDPPLRFQVQSRLDPGAQTRPDSPPLSHWRVGDGGPVKLNLSNSI